jgi:hypothetical protein
VLTAKLLTDMVPKPALGRPSTHGVGLLWRHLASQHRPCTGCRRAKIEEVMAAPSRDAPADAIATSDADSGTGQVAGHGLHGRRPKAPESTVCVPERPERSERCSAP